MSRPFAVNRAPRGGQAQHGQDAGYSGKRKAKPFVVSVVKFQLCHIRRKCVNAVCGLCAASLDDPISALEHSYLESWGVDE